jgi:hypothetical protein
MSKQFNEQLSNYELCKKDPTQCNYPSALCHEDVLSLAPVIINLSTRWIPATAALP